MIETILRNYLNSVLSVPTYLEIPKSVPDSYILMELVDAGVVNKIDAATFTFTCKADSLYNAATLANEVIKALENSITLDEISSAKMGGKSDAIENNKYQYVVTFNFFYYREEI